MAPIFDSGNSFGYDKTERMMKDKDEIICKPFKKTHAEQLKLVSSFEWLDFSVLDEVPAIIREVMSDDQATEYVEERRINMICELAGQRIDYLRSIRRESEGCIM